MTLKWQFDFRCCCLSKVSRKVLALVNTSKNRDNCICLAAMDDAVTVDYSIQSYFLAICFHNAPPVVTNSCLRPGRMQGQCSVGQGLPPLHESRCGWVFLTVASNLQMEAAPGSPQRQHGGGPICGELRAICPKSRKCLSVTRWERERMASCGCCDFHIRHIASIWYPQEWDVKLYYTIPSISRILRSAHMSNASMREHWSFVMDHVSHLYNKTGTM